MRGGWFADNGANEFTRENDASAFILSWQAGEITLPIEYLMHESYSSAYPNQKQMRETIRPSQQKNCHVILDSLSY